MQKGGKAAVLFPIKRAAAADLDCSALLLARSFLFSRVAPLPWKLLLLSPLSSARITHLVHAERDRSRNGDRKGASKGSMRLFFLRDRRARFVVLAFFASSFTLTRSFLFFISKNQKNSETFF